MKKYKRPRVNKNPKIEDFYMTVGELKAVLAKVPDNAPVYYERIEDVYFKKHGWSKTSEKIKTPSIVGMDEGEYVQAFTAVVQDGKVLITAHY